MRIGGLVGVVLLLGLAMAVPVLHAQAPKGKKEFAFAGKVEKVDAKAKTLTVNNDNIDGWMSSMSMTYTVDKPDVLPTLKEGDRITAKVYDGDFKTLYDVKAAPPAKK